MQWSRIWPVELQPVAGRERSTAPPLLTATRPPRPDPPLQWAAGAAAEEEESRCGRERVATPRGVMARQERQPARPLLAVLGRFGRIRTYGGL
jgi:hypothetical protein